MKASPQNLTTISLIAIASCVTSLSTAQDRRYDRPASSTSAPAARTGTSVDLTDGVWIASIDAEARSLRRYDGQKLLNTEGGTLGTIKDLIVHVPSSHVRYLVVSSGGVLGGIGNSLRLVPVEAVRPGRQPKTFEVDILQSAWLQIPPVSDDNYIIDRFEISDAQHQEMVRHYGAANRTQPHVLASAPSTQRPAVGLIRGSALTGKTVRADGRKVGKIENIIVDLERGMAAALIDSSGDFTGTTAKYLVPLNRLVLDSPNQNPITTTLTRADFDRARPSTFAPVGTTAALPATTSTEPSLPLTGRPSTTPAVAIAVSDTLAASARAVRRAIDNDPALVAERVQVLPENNRVVLRGSVRDEMTRTKIETAARHALPAGNIENRIVVENR